MTHAYMFLKPKRALASASEATAENLRPHQGAEVRFTLDTALHGMKWATPPAPGESVSGRYDGPGGWVEVALGLGHHEILTVRTAARRASERLIQSLCDRTGWTALDLQTLKLLAPRPVPDLGYLAE